MVFAIAGILSAVPTIPVAAGDGSRACTLTLLPAEMQRHIQTNYSSWRLQDVSDLSANAKERWQSEKPVDCPGLAVGQFEKPDQKSYAALLVPTNKPDTGHRLLVFTPTGSVSSEAFRVIDQSDGIGASNFFVHQIKIAKVFSSEWVKKLRVVTKDGILLWMLALRNTKWMSIFGRAISIDTSQ